MEETFESVFMGLPKGCVLKTPNSYNSCYTCAYKPHSKRAVVASADTPSQAVVRLAQLLAEKGITS